MIRMLLVAVSLLVCSSANAGEQIIRQGGYTIINDGVASITAIFVAIVPTVLVVILVATAITTSISFISAHEEGSASRYLGYTGVFQILVASVSALFVF